jgi:ABC-2 type transport system permease protein
MSATAAYLPLTHGIAAARRLAVGAPPSTVAGQIGVEFLIGVGYAVVGLLLLRLFEDESRRRSTLDRT